MTLTHGLARSFMAPIFISGGIDGFRNPQEKAKAAAPVIARLSTSLGIPDNAVQAVRINGIVQIAAGSLLALGRLPRLSSAALAISLVPTTLAGHRYWEEADPDKRSTQRTELFKNLAMLGGLVFAATDTGGAPSLAWRAGRRAKQTQKQAVRVANQAATMVHAQRRGHSGLADLGERAITIAAALGERASHVGERAAKAATHGAAQLGHAAEAGFEHLTAVAHDQLENAAQQTSAAGRYTAHLVSGLADSARSGASHLGDRAALLRS